MKPGLRKIRSASSYGRSHLESIRVDMDGEDYSPSMRSDMDLAMSILRAAPDLLDAVHDAARYLSSPTEWPAVGRANLFAKLDAAIKKAGVAP